MIKYPVWIDTTVSKEDIKKIKGVETYHIVDTSGRVIARTHNEEDAETIANALNAMNKTSVCNHQVGDDISQHTYLEKVGENTRGDTLWCETCGSILYVEYSVDEKIDYIAKVEKIK